MSRAAVARARRRRALAAAVAFSVLVGAGLTSLLGPRPARGQGEAAAVAQPVLGTNAQATVFGAASDPSEAWAYELRNRTLAPAPVEYAAGNASQLVFQRWTAATGWRYDQAPVGSDGQPWAGGAPFTGAGAITPHGGGFLVVDDRAAPVGRRTVGVVRDPGGRWRALPWPDPAVLLPTMGVEPAETLGDAETRNAAAAATDGPDGRTVVYVATGGRRLDAAVLRWDGDWHREPVCVEDSGGARPADCPPGETLTGPQGDAKIVAVAASSPDDAWLLMTADPSLHRGLTLFTRSTTGGMPHWRPVDVGAPAFAADATPALSIDGMRARPAPGALTATADGVWIDARFTQRGTARDATIFLTATSHDATTWCDAIDGAGAPVCDHPFGLRFSTRSRSFAWAGGRRIITQPLDPGDLTATETSRRGDYATLRDGAFARADAFGGLEGDAFSSPTEGWLGTTHVTTAPEPNRLTPVPVALTAPIVAVTGAPGAVAGAADAGALAVGQQGAVARYTPGSGWDTEFLLDSGGGTARPNLRGVAWPEPGFAYAVGDRGAMWRWRGSIGLWEPDPAAPFDFEGNLMSVAFQAGSATRGYAVGRSGVLLRYDKQWTQEPLPEEIRHSGFNGGPPDLTSVAFAGGQALVAGGKVLVDDGAGWRVDAQLAELLGDNPIQIVAGLPDGGAVAAGFARVAVRDGAAAPWRLVDQPLPSGYAVIAASAVREGDRVRAVVSVTRAGLDSAIPPAVDPGRPAPLLGPIPLPGEGFVLRETASGWRDERHDARISPTSDKPPMPDPVLGFALGPDGSGWAVGGWTGSNNNLLGQGTADAGVAASVRTAAIFRYSPNGGAPAAPAAGAAPVPMAPGPVRFAVGGESRCVESCGLLTGESLLPDAVLEAGLGQAATLAARPGGPRAFLFTGGRVAAPGAAIDQGRAAELLAGRPGLPVFPAVGTGESAGGSTSIFRGAFAPFPAPFGVTGAASGLRPVPDATAAASGARTHYAFDSTGPEGAVRVIVIDNSAGSLAASDPLQNPAEPQLPWLRARLAEARAGRVPAIVVGHRDLAVGATSLNVAADGAEVARVLRDGGASAYFFDRPGESRSRFVPTGAADGVPEFGTGTLGYRLGANEPGNVNSPFASFSSPAFLLAEIDATRRDPATNRAPVAVRVQPVLADLVLEATDGVLLRRSSPSLFRGLGRRPRGGDRWGFGTALAGSSPYVAFPADLCQEAGCAGGLAPEYRFTSSDPDIADFVKRDPATSNLRKPYIDPRTDKVVLDDRDGILCPFNAGTTTITIEAGGLRYSRRVTVLAGSALRPCGTTPLNPARFAPVAPDRPDVSAPPAAPPDAAPAAASSPPVPPPPAPPAAAAPPAPPAKAAPVKPPVQTPQPVPQPSPLPSLVPIAPPPPPTSVRPTPPSGTSPVSASVPLSQPVAQVEREREEETAVESSQAYAAVRDEDPRTFRGPVGIAAAVVLAAAGAGAVRSRRRDPRAYVVNHHHGRPPR